MLSQTRFSELYRIKKQGDRGIRSNHPEYQMIVAAEHRFFECAIRQHHRITGQYPTVLRFPPPANDAEAAVQIVARAWMSEEHGRPIPIVYTGASPKPPHRIPHAFRVARRTMLIRRRG